jgi:hypothetical protein
MTTLQRWALDTVERAGSTFVVTFLVQLAGNQTNAFSIDVLKAAALSAAFAAATIVKTAIASRFGARSSGSLLTSDPGPVPIASP